MDIAKRLMVVAGIFFTTLLWSQTSSALVEIKLADPTIFYENGKYYMSGTRAQAPLGFSVLTSQDLKNWSAPDERNEDNYMIIKPGANIFGTSGFWAPQFFKESGRYYLTYTANSQIALASSLILTGTYSQPVVKAIDAGSNNIDSYLFKDDDGKYYLYHVRFNKGNYLWVAEFDLAKGSIKTETLQQCFTTTQPWETTPAYDSNPIMEGPTVIRMRGMYYMFYSANHFRSIDYAVGFATAKSPYGPWKKYAGNPIIHRSIVGENGTGHGDLFFDKNNDPYYVYHVHNSETTVGPRKTRIVPLIFELGCEAGDSIYTISVKKGNVIVPVMKK